MRENHAASAAVASGSSADPEAAFVTAGGDATATAAPDMAPTDDAFDTMAAFDMAATDGRGAAGQDDHVVEDAGDDVPASAVPAARSGLVARIPGERRQWMLAGMVSGGILLGALASGGIGWKMIGTRNAEVQARTAKLDQQSSRLAEQEARIEALTRAVNERPLPDEATAVVATERLALAAHAALLPAPGANAPEARVALAPPVEPPRPAAKAVAPASPRGEARQPGAAAGAAPAVAGSGVCDVPGGTDGAAQMRRCIEWFAGRGTPGAGPAP